MASRLSRSTLIPAVIAAVVVAVAIVIGLMQLRTPSAQPVNVAADQFSADRARGTVEATVGNGVGHPVGTADLADVRNKLVAQIRSYGYEPIIDSGVATTQWIPDTKTVIDPNPPSVTSPLTTAEYANIIVRVPGTDPSHQAVLVAAHYDSVPPGPGATDDMSSCAAMVETLRALKASGPLAHDVIFLFTDGEEIGERGAREFTGSNPMAKDVRYVLNFEARGTTGKSLFFEANQMSSQLLGDYHQAQPSPMTGSVFYFAFQQIENNTDFSVFRSLGVPGLSFALIGDFVRYHTPTDDVENFSTSSLQYTGDMMLGLVRNISNRPTLGPQTEQNITWFNVGPVLVSYPGFVGYLVVIIGLALFVTALVIGRRRSLITWRGAGRGLATAGLAVVVSIAITQALIAIIYFARWDVRDFLTLRPSASTDPYRGTLYMATIIIVVSAAVIGLVLRARKLYTGESVQLGVLTLWGLLSVLTILAAPQASYLFAMPFVLMSAALAVRAFKPARWITLTIELVAAALTLIFLVPLIALFYQALTLSTGFISALLAGITVALLGPVIDTIAESTGQWLSLGLVGIAAVMLIVGIATPLVGPNNQQVANLAFSYEADTGKAEWISEEKQNDEWTQTVLGSDPTQEPAPQFMLPYFRKGPEKYTVVTNPARSTPTLQTPMMTVMSDTTVGSTRTVKMSLTSPRQADNLWYTISTKGQLQTLTVNGQKPPITPSDSWTVIGYGVPEGGYTVEFTTPPGNPISVEVTDQTTGFPDDPALGLPPRPDWTMPFWPRGKEPDATLVTKTFAVK